AHPRDCRKDHERVTDSRHREHRQRRIRSLEHDEQADERDAVDAVHDRLPERIASQDDERSAQRDEAERDGLKRHEGRDQHYVFSRSLMRRAARAVAITSAGFRTKRRPTVAIACSPAADMCTRTSTAMSTRNAGALVAAPA